MIMIATFFVPNQWVSLIRGTVKVAIIFTNLYLFAQEICRNYKDLLKFR